MQSFVTYESSYQYETFPVFGGAGVCVSQQILTLILCDVFGFQLKY